MRLLYKWKCIFRIKLTIGKLNLPVEGEECRTNYLAIIKVSIIEILRGWSCIWSRSRLKIYNFYFILPLSWNRSRSHIKMLRTSYHWYQTRFRRPQKWLWMHSLYINLDICTLLEIWEFSCVSNMYSTLKWGVTKEVLQKESGRRLCYIYSRCTICMELFQRLVAPLVLKIGIHQGQARRKGVRGGEEEGWSGGVESFSS
jgi:hypothetical protein